MALEDQKQLPGSRSPLGGRRAGCCSDRPFAGVVGAASVSALPFLLGGFSCVSLAVQSHSLAGLMATLIGAFTPKNDAPRPLGR